MRVLVITADSELRWDDLTELEDFQRVVGGFIEHVRLNDECSMFIDEDGKRKQLMPNPVASGLMRIHSQIAGIVVGDAVIAGPSHGTGVNSSLSDDARTVEIVRRLAEAFGGTWV